jgi:hypothetical protein
MRVGCATCHTAFDVEDEAEVHRDGPHVCSACRTMGSIDVAISATTVVDEAAAVTRERRMQLDFDDTSPGGFERDPLPLAERSSQPPAPVSLEDLAMILAPGVDPPRIGGPASGGEVPQGWVALSPPVAPPSRPARVPSAAGSDDLGSDDLAAMATHAPAPPRSAPVSAQIRAESIPAPRDSNVQDLELMAALCPPPAPSSRSRAADLTPVVGARPSRSPLPISPRSRPRGSRPQLESQPERARIEPTYDEPSGSDSRMTDIRTMTAMYPGDLPDEPPALVPAIHLPPAGDDLIGMSGVMKLSGDLFRGEALAPLITPDLSMRTAPTESLPPTAATVTPTAPMVRRPATRPRPAAVPVTTKRAVSAPSSRRSGLMLGLAAVCIAGYFLATRSADAPPPVEVTEAAAAEEAVAEPAVAPPPVEEPSLDDTPVAASTAAASASASSTAMAIVPAAAAARVPLPATQPAITAKPAAAIRPSPPAVTARPITTAAPLPTTATAPTATAPAPPAQPAPTAAPPPAPTGSQFDKSITDNPY